MHAHAGVVVGASLKEDAAVGCTFALAMLEPTLQRGKVGGTRMRRRWRVSYSTAFHVSSTPDICVVETTFEHEKERCLSRAYWSSRHFNSSSGCFLLGRKVVFVRKTRSVWTVLVKMEDGAAKHEGQGISASARGTLPEALCALFVFAGCTELALEVLCIDVQHRAELIEICACANDFQTSKKRDIIGESLTFRTAFSVAFL